MVERGTFRVKKGMAEMQKKLLWMLLTRNKQNCRQLVPWQSLEGSGGYPQGRRGSHMADPEIILSIMEAVTIPVMAKCRIGHFAEAQVCNPLELTILMRAKY